MKRRRKKQTDSQLEKTFLEAWRKTQNVGIVTQYKFHPRRLWRFDFAFPTINLAIEIQGFGRGHNSYMGMHKDYQKHNSAVRLGWSVIYLMSKDLTAEEIDSTIRWIRKLYDRRKHGPDTNQS